MSRSCSPLLSISLCKYLMSPTVALLTVIMLRFVTGNYYVCSAEKVEVIYPDGKKTLCPVSTVKPRCTAPRNNAVSVITR